MSGVSSAAMSPGWSLSTQSISSRRPSAMASIAGRTWPSQAWRVNTPGTLAVLTNSARASVSPTICCRFNAG
ncbi:hypothetical protein D3C81_1930330 [compost metagenome]